MEKLAYSIPEFLEWSGLGSRSGFYQEVNSNRLKTVKVGRRRLVPAEAAKEWLALLQREAEEAQA